MLNRSNTRGIQHGRVRLHLVAAALLVASALAIPARGEAQGWLDGIKKKVADGVAQKVDEHKAKAESTVVTTTTNAADSALTKTNRGVGATVDKASDVANKGMNGAENGVKGLFAGVMTTPDQMAADLKAGRVTIRDIEFGGVEASDLKPTSDVVLQKLASALTSAPGNFLIESHTNLVGDSDIEQALSDRRSAAVKARLVSLGVPEERLSAKGFGATRPADGNTKGATTNARIEVSRVP
jgi:outer membrane protein OmpA-like peptidoglycan-associated protein